MIDLKEFEENKHKCPWHEILGEYCRATEWECLQETCAPAFWVDRVDVALRRYLKTLEDDLR